MSKRSRRMAPGDTTRAGAAGGSPAASGRSGAAPRPGAGSSARPTPGGAGSPPPVTRSASAAAAASPAASGRTTPGGPVPGAFGNRRAAGRGESVSTSPTGTPRAGRRTQSVASQRSFVERFRTQLIWGGIIAGVLLIAGFVLLSASSPTYACSIQLDPASPAPSASVVGQAEDDMTRGHVAVGTAVTYTYCPPASGKHFNASGQGPIPARYYGPDDATLPQGWIHNLEHGGIAILYNCARNGCDSNSQDKLKALVTNFPASPVCKIPGGLISPVITRFDQMKASFAAVVWDRVLFQDTLDTAQMLEFFKNVGEKDNPEPQCNPNASSSPSVTSNPASPDVASPAVEPAPSGSAGASAPAASASAPSAPSASTPAASAPAPSATPSST